jgi:hypothetical protein
MKTKIETIEELKAVINFILWNYNEYCAEIADKMPTVKIGELESKFLIKISYVGGIEKAIVELNPELQDDDKVILTEYEFTLLKSEGFKQLNKYVEDICDSISEIDLEK